MIWFRKVRLRKDITKLHEIGDQEDMLSHLMEPTPGMNTVWVVPQPSARVSLEPAYVLPKKQASSSRFLPCIRNLHGTIWTDAHHHCHHCSNSLSQSLSPAITMHQHQHHHDHWPDTFNRETSRPYCSFVANHHLWVLKFYHGHIIVQGWRLKSDKET